MISYSTAIVATIMGENASNTPFQDLNLEIANPKNNTLIVSNNLIPNDNNLYSLVLKNQHQYKIVYDLLMKDQKPISYLLKNNYTYNGQYLEFVYETELLQMDIIVRGYKKNKTNH